MKKVLTLLTAILLLVLESCTNEYNQYPLKVDSESMTDREVIEIYDNYSALFKSSLSGVSRGESNVVDPVKLAKILRPMTIEELEGYIDSLETANSEFPTKATDPQARINQLLGYLTAMETAAFITFTEEYPFAEDRAGYLQSCTQNLHPQLQRMYAYSAASMDNVALPYVQTLLEPVELIHIYNPLNIDLKPCEVQLIWEAVSALGEDAAILFYESETGVMAVLDVAMEDLADGIWAYHHYLKCKKESYS